MAPTPPNTWPEPNPGPEIKQNSVARGRRTVHWIKIAGLMLFLLGHHEVWAQEAPTQINGTGEAIVWGDYLLHPRAQWQGTLRVAATRVYDDNSRESALSPVDVTLSWGPLDDPLLLQNLLVWPGRRWLQIGYRYDHVEQEWPVDRVLDHMAQIHAIPASQAVADAMKSIPVGESVFVKGLLVDIQHDDGWQWRTSLVRNDRGQGACEILLIQQWILQEDQDVGNSP